MILAFLLMLQAAPATAEEPIDPYPQSNANAGARAFDGAGMLAAFHGRAGIDRVVEDFVRTNQSDPRIGDIFKGQDMIRLRRTLKEQFCYILNGGCDYTGRDMKSSHKDLGIQQADMGALVENLQAAMRREGVAFMAQNRFLAKLAPMRRDVITR